MTIQLGVHIPQWRGTTHWQYQVIVWNGIRFWTFCGDNYMTARLEARVAHGQAPPKSICL